MTKIAGALNMLPQTFLREGISNTSAKEAIEIYKADGDYPKFYRNFKHYYLLGEIGWLGCCLCHRYKFDGKILVKS
jgi:hypothetical protein